MILWLVSNVVLSLCLVTGTFLALWFLRRCWRVVKIYSNGYTWCKVITLKGTHREGWVSITSLRSIHGHQYASCPLFKLKTKTEWVTINPGEFESIHEVLGLVKVAWKGGSIVI